MKWTAGGFASGGMKQSPGRKGSLGNKRAGSRGAGQAVCGEHKVALTYPQGGNKDTPCGCECVKQCPALQP